MPVPKILEAFRRPPGSNAGLSSSSNKFSIALDLGKSFAARDPQGHPCLLVPLSQMTGHPGRSTRSLQFTQHPKVEFELAGRRWEAPAAAIVCTDNELLETFCVVVDDIAARLAQLADPPPTELILALVRKWERLFEVVRTLSPDEEIALWGELWLIDSATVPDQLVAAWVRPTRASVDFAGDGLGILCRSSLSRLQHYLTQSEIEEASSAQASCFTSLWLAVDSLTGTSLPEMIDRVEGRLAAANTFHEKLVQRGYFRDHRHKYTRAFRLVEEPLWFRMSDVPRVRDADAGVSAIRFLVDLSPERALGASDTKTTKTKLLGTIAEPANTTQSKMSTSDLR